MSDVDVSSWGCCGDKPYNINTQECCTDGPRDKGDVSNPGGNGGTGPSNPGSSGEPVPPRGGGNGNGNGGGPNGGNKPTIGQKKPC